MKILITGIAGFIGYHTAKKAVALGYEVVGIDNLNNYYDVKLKLDRLSELGLKGEDGISKKYPNLKFAKLDIINHEDIMDLFEDEKFDAVINLAAQAGVRHSIDNPREYIQSNTVGFLNILEGCRHLKVKHLIYASSSSVYGQAQDVPFRTENPVDHPVSLYAATKRSNELMAHSYSHLFNLPTTGLRYFTVYGPWGRPDMAPFLFTKAIFERKSIKVFNHGDMERDFTYVEDVATASLKLLDKTPTLAKDRKTPNQSSAPFKIYNIANSSPVNLLQFIKNIEQFTGLEAEKEFLPMQAGDVPRTYADVEDLFELIGYRPTTSLEQGIQKFIEWYRLYYKVRV